MVKNLPVYAGGAGDMGLIPGSGRFLWSRKWQPTTVFFPGEFYGQRSLQAVHEVTKSWRQLIVLS